MLIGANEGFSFEKADGAWLFATSWPVGALSRFSLSGGAMMWLVALTLLQEDMLSLDELLTWSVKHGEGPAFTASWRAHVMSLWS